MVTIEQVQKGMVAFIDREVVPSLSIVEKVAVGGGVGLVAAKLPEILNLYVDHKAVSVLNLYDREHREIDLDAVYNAIKPYVGADPIPVSVPFIGLKLKFTQREIDALYRYIKEV